MCIRDRSEVEGQRQALFLASVDIYPVRQRGREEEEISGLGHQARRQLPVQQDQLAGFVWHPDVVDAGEEFVVLVMIMDAGALSRGLGVEPEAQAEGFVAIIQDGAGAGFGMAKDQIQFRDALTFQIEVLEATAKKVGAGREVSRIQLAKGRQDAVVDVLGSWQLAAVDGGAGPESG